MEEKQYFFALFFSVKNEKGYFIQPHVFIYEIPLYSFVLNLKILNWIISNIKIRW